MNIVPTWPEHLKNRWVTKSVPDILSALICDDHAPRLNTICHKQVGRTAMLVDSDSTENTGQRFGLPQKAEK